MKKEAPLEELRNMEKTMENTKNFVRKYLPKVAFDYHQNKGLPVDIFVEEMEIKNMSLAQQLVFIIHHYEKKLK